jgi:hypothetical protein
MVPFYASEDSALSPKCQCVTFEKSGQILGSCDSLFEVSGMTPEKTEQFFPFLRTVAMELSSGGYKEDPLFYPGLDFNFREYHSICDFTFMKTTDARGNERFVWLIYDNSTHYRLLIHQEKPVQHHGRKQQHQTVTSTTFRRAG